MNYTAYYSSNVLISMPVNSSNFTLVLFKTACHDNPAAARNFAGWS